MSACTCPPSGPWHQSECPANTYTHHRQKAPRVAITVDCEGQGVMHVDVDDSRPGGIVPGEETCGTFLRLRIVKDGQEVNEAIVPLEAVRAAIARRRL